MRSAYAVSIRLGVCRDRVARSGTPGLVAPAGMMKERLVRRLRMAHGARVDLARVTLQGDRLHVVRRHDGGLYRVGAAVAGLTMHIAVADGVAVQRVRLLELEAGALVTAGTAAARLGHPRLASRVGDGGHRAMAGLASEARTEVDIAETLGSHAGMACVALVGDRDGAHARRVRAMHGPR